MKHLVGITFTYTETIRESKLERQAVTSWSKTKDCLIIEWGNHIGYTDLQNLLYNIKRHDTEKYKILENTNPEYFL